jgi:hypothetical protein
VREYDYEEVKKNINHLIDTDRGGKKRNGDSKE